MHLEILVVEADQVLREVLGELLEAWGCHVFLAADAIEAARQLEANSSIQAALVEDNMRRDIDGVATVRQLKAMRNDVYFFLYVMIEADARNRDASTAGIEAIWSKGETELLKENLGVLDSMLNPCPSD